MVQRSKTTGVVAESAYAYPNARLDTVYMSGGRDRSGRQPAASRKECFYDAVGNYNHSRPYDDSPLPPSYPQQAGVSNHQDITRGHSSASPVSSSWARV